MADGFNSAFKGLMSSG